MRDVRYAPIFLLGSILMLVVLLLAADLLSADTINSLEQQLPDQLLYSVHATAGEASTLVGISPWYSATQWVKAASHAESSADVDKAAQGIASARARSRDDPSLDDYLCTLAERNSDQVRMSVTRAGVRCVGS